MELVNYIILLNLAVSIVILYFIFTISKKMDSSHNKISQIKQDTNTKIELLNDEKYYYYVLNTLSSAKKEINIIMFSMYKCKKTADLIYALINARKRGVMVRVILDGEVESNRTLKHLLSSERIPVKLTNHQRIHNKLIIVDDNIVVLGSHNWTDKALFENRESSVAIIDKKIVKREKDYFELLWGSIK
jgi:phosphatidylserine/phosphatidylglycerophosphate/cardiolipin synthase-like enzyme